ncbi:uncharacterized protein LOC130991929 [Salvia miltiorrhiza]|uniref:uncharacterized protein LOC130991929 n=1 Tax=Salvia miltiorrhiza TaxID=226208 RepID=UPI0025AC6DA8|nr:uncharacterized protein LOC130991929 [Salvia miltiorrhiza]
MTTLAADAIPRFIVMKSKPYSDKGHAYFKADAKGSGGSVVLGEADVFSTLVKMEAERSTSDNKYISLRFGYSNRYWVLKANSNLIVAESDQPDEDTTKPTCTLFEAVKVDDFFYLIHVQSGGRVLIDSKTLHFFLKSDVKSDEGYLTFVDWDSLVKLPPRVAFKGDNGKYLGTMIAILNFTYDDPNAEASIYVVEQSPDGNVRIKWGVADEQYWYWAQDNNDLIEVDPVSQGNQFWPVKMDENSIALRSIYNKQFCRHLSNDVYLDCLSASAPTITKQAIMQVQELVLDRKMTNVKYQMEYGRIFNEQPYLGGTSQLTNEAEEEASMSVSITYTDEKTSTFTGGFSLTAGVSASIEAGVPLIEKATITVNYSATATFEWSTETKTSTSVTASGTVPVPGRSTVTVEYVGTKGTCNIPFSYTQADKSSTDGHTTYTEVSDGVYTGVNCYNFYFTVTSVEPLPASSLSLF